MQFSLGDRDPGTGSGRPGGQGGGQGKGKGGGRGGAQGGRGGRGAGQGDQGGGRGAGTASATGTAARHGTSAAAGAPRGGRQLIGGAWPGQKQVKQAKTGQGEEIPDNVEEALRRLAVIFHFPTSKDVVFRKFTVKTRPPTRAFILYIEGMADTKRVESEILYPLLKLPLQLGVRKSHVCEFMLNAFLPAGAAERKATIDEVVAGVVTGEVAIVTETGAAVLVDVKGPPARQPAEPLTERTVRGPQMGFTESHRTNTAMLRTFIHDPDLVIEQLSVGRRTKTQVSFAYIADIANPRLVAEVRRRLLSVDIDGVMDSGSLQRFIDDHPISLVPTILTTERPDRVAAEVLQGAVGILVGNSTRVLVAPATFSVFLHTAEDIYLKFPFASFLRVLRLVALTLGFLLPGAYIAVVNFHQEMIPTPLLLTLAASREAIPFPLIFDLVAMELAFELIREAGLRVPSAIGTTIGIVGALLLGDMAVRSGLVSPTVVIVVAITALASFAVSDPEAAFAVRLGRFIFIGLSGTLGFYGLALGFFVLTVHLASIKSFGVPYLSPIGPWRAGSLDVVLFGPAWDQEKRRIYLRPLDLISQARYSRAWDPGVPGETQAPEGESGRGQGGGPGPGRAREKGPAPRRGGPKKEGPGRGTRP